jgi:hypothetical protein
VTLFWHRCPGCGHGWACHRPFGAKVGRGRGRPPRVVPPCEGDHYPRETTPKACTTCRAARKAKAEQTARESPPSADPSPGGSGGAGIEFAGAARRAARRARTAPLREEA